MGVSQTTRRKIAQVVARQSGHVTRRQLLDAGVPATTIDAWIRDGWLVPIYAGVYAFGYRRPDPAARAMAAVLAAGPHAVLSHDSALALWGLRRWPATHEVIAPGRVRRNGITAHRSTTLSRAQTTLWLGVPTTRAARAITDMRSRLTPRQRTRLTNHGRLEGVISADEAAALLGHRRNATRSALEDDFQRFVERHGLPQPSTNVTVAGFEVDAYWPDRRLIVELDDEATHGDPVTFASDRERDAVHAALHIRTIRLLAVDLKGKRGERTAHLLRQALAVLPSSYGLLDEL
ncbi:MAG TPA: type IV toxin-antitoxin system AbiEi family antitoxin domain-containing protein [Solirubrobacteraceae bacterium]